MLGVGLLLVGGALCAFFGAHNVGDVVIQSWTAAALQVGPAIAGLLRSMAASLAMIIALAAQLTILLIVGLIAIVFTLPSDGSALFVAHDFQPVHFTAIVAAMAGITVLYAFAMRSAWRLGTAHAPQLTSGAPADPTLPDVRDAH